MPFIDLNSFEGNFETSSYDVTIAGAGAVGIFLAVELSKAGKRVLLLETGHFTEADEKQQLNELEQTGKFLHNAVWGRKRVVGGTTISWGGQSLPFKSIDFEKREWVKLSGWPINYEELKPFYNEANSFMKIDLFNYHEDIFSKIKIKPPQFDTALLDFHVSKWANEPNFYKLHKIALENQVTVFYNAQLLAINKNNKGTIENITVSNFKQNTFVISPGILVIAAGAIESARLLLSNNIVAEDSKAWIGKCFMDHPCIEVANIASQDAYKLQRLFNTHKWKGKKYSIRLTLSEKAQKKHQLLNCSASILFRPPENDFDVYGEIKNFTNDYKAKRLAIILKNGRPLLKSAFALYRHNFYYKKNAVARLILMTEQEPLEESCITLGSDVDFFGVKKAVLHWDISAATWKTILKITGIVSEEFSRLGISTVQPFAHVSEGNEKWKDSLTDVNHHMGGARMSATSNTGVVDKNLKVWGTSNLYVCSCAVFPTVSHSNPTLTLLALAARLNKHLM